MRIGITGLAIAALAITATATLAADLSASAAGPNLATNGTFASNTSGWSSQFPEFKLSWDAGGAAKVTNQRLDQLQWGNPAWAQQCVTGVTAGTAYELSAKVKVPSGQARDGYGLVELAFNDGANCMGNSLFNPDASEVHAIGSWQASTLAWAQAPQGSKSVLVLLVSSVYPPTGSQKITDGFSALFDDVVLDVYSPPATPSPTDTPPPATATPPTATATPPAPTWTPTQKPTVTSTPSVPEATPPPPTTTPPVIILSGDGPSIPTLPAKTPTLTPPPASTPSPTSTTSANSARTSTATQPGEPQHTQESPESPATPLPPQTGSGQSFDDGVPRYAVLGVATLTISGLLLLIRPARRR